MRLAYLDYISWELINKRCFVLKHYATNFLKEGRLLLELIQPLIRTDKLILSEVRDIPQDFYLNPVVLKARTKVIVTPKLIAPINS